jgi:hypothetical protein
VKEIEIFVYLKTVAIAVQQDGTTTLKLFKA